MDSIIAPLTLQNDFKPLIIKRLWILNYTIESSQFFICIMCMSNDQILMRDEDIFKQTYIGPMVKNVLEELSEDVLEVVANNGKVAEHDLTSYYLNLLL